TAIAWRYCRSRTTWSEACASGRWTLRWGRTGADRSRPPRGSQLDLDRTGGAQRPRSSQIGTLIPRQHHTHAPQTFHRRLAEQAQLGIGLAQGLVQVAVADVARVALDQNHRRGGRTILADLRNRQAENGPGMQGKLRQLLGDQGHQPGVVGTGRHLVEPDLITLDEHLHAEYPAPAERIGDAPGHVLGLCQRLLAHLLGLPGFAVVATLLTMADRRTEAGATGMAHGQQGDLVIESDKAFDNDPAEAGTAAGLGVVPRRLYILLAAHQTLTLAGGTHHRRDHTGQTDFADCCQIVIAPLGKTVGRGRQLQFLAGQVADALTVH